MTANGANKITDDFLNLINIFETNITGKRVTQRISVAPKMQTQEAETTKNEPVLVQQSDFTTNNNVKDAPCASPHIDNPVSSNEEKKQIDSGMELAGSMSFGHIYQELTFHFCGYRTLPTWTSYYDSCVIADLNYDENRLICRPMRWIEVPSY